MKVDMAVVKAEFRETRALTPDMMGKAFPVPNEAWAAHIETMSKGRVRRVPAGADNANEPEQAPPAPKRRGRPPKIQSS